MAALLPLFRHTSRVAHATADGELLTRFASRRDEEAFAELVRRHGPVVYRICCRLVGANAADDAFQAVFLVLATRLQAACAAKSVSGWLVGVAGRVARQMQRASRRRMRHETAAAETRPLECVDQTSDLTDQFRVLDEELSQLPAYLRDPVVLCLLRGFTQEQAAIELGRDARTLRRRLERAKQVLRMRLERRGVIPAVAVALVAGTGDVSATIPSSLTTRTVAIVFDFLTGGTTLAGVPSVALAKGVATTMLTRKLMSLMAAATIGLVGLGVVFAADNPLPAPTPSQPLTAASSVTSSAPQSQPTQPTTPPVVLQPEIGPAKDEGRNRALLTAMRQSAKPGESAVLIEAMCLRVPNGFCEESGLTAEESPDGVWRLTSRERRMLGRLFRAEKSQGTVEIFCRPHLSVNDGQQGTVQVGQQAPIVTGFDAETKNGKTVYTPKLSKVDVGWTLNVTPRIRKSGYVQLQVEIKSSELVGERFIVPVTTNDGNTKPPRTEYLQLSQGGTNEQARRTAIFLPDGGTAVIRSEVSTRQGNIVSKREELWLITAHIIRSEKKNKDVIENPVLVAPGQPTAASYRKVFEKCMDVLDDSFELETPNMYEGRITTKPKVLPASGEWTISGFKLDIPGRTPPQKVRQTATVDIRTGEKGGYLVHVVVEREQEEVSRSTPSGKENHTWRKIGRDSALEQELLRRIQDSK